MLPQTDIAVIGATQYKACIEGICHTKHLLHALCMVDVARSSTFADVPQAHSAVVRARDKTLARGCPVDRHDRADMTLVDLRCRRHVPHVKRIHVIVFASHGKCGRLKRRPGEVIGTHSKHNLVQCFATPHIVQCHTAIRSSARKHIRLTLVVPHHMHSIHTHRHGHESVRTAAAVQVPYLHSTRRRSKARQVRMMRQGMKCRSSLIHRQRLTRSKFGGLHTKQIRISCARHNIAVVVIFVLFIITHIRPVFGVLAIALRHRISIPHFDCAVCRAREHAF